MDRPLPGTNRQPKLLDRRADALHRRSYMPALVRSHCDWVRRFIFFHHLRHPAEMGPPEVAAYLGYLHEQAGATLFQQTEAERALAGKRGGIR